MSDRRAIFPAALVIALATLAAYANSFRDAFVYDDPATIVDNPTIRTLWPISVPLSPPAGSGLPVDGRPLVNLSFALNHAFAGTSVVGYHAVNLAIHVGAALALFGIVRRTLMRCTRGESLAPGNGASALVPAFVAALLWSLHPLNTESVTYVSQRAESLMGLFFLLTLYAAIRAFEIPARDRGDDKSAGASPASRTAIFWSALAVLACVAGMASKEVMVAAPIVVLVYDRTFVSGTFSEALRMRPRLYAALALTWLPLAWLVAHAGSRGGTAGFETTVTPWTYALTQSLAIVHYLRLSVWPHPLVFDYGTDVITRFADAAPFVALLAALAGVTAFALFRRVAVAEAEHGPRTRSPSFSSRAFGFLGFCFFATLAPTSSIVPISTEILAEHRMYLALAPVMVALVIGTHHLFRRPIVTLAVGVAAAVGLGFLTARRNADYASELALWSDTVAKRPDNARAQFNLGEALGRAGKFPDAITSYENAVRLKPAFASAQANLANALLQSGRLVEARQHAQTALRINPRLAEAHATLANILYTGGDVLAALPQYQESVRLAPDNAALRNNLGAALSRLDRLPDALAEYAESLRLDPANADTCFFLGNTLARLGRFAEAAQQYESALRLRPDFDRARENLARVRALDQRTPPR